MSHSVDNRGPGSTAVGRWLGHDRTKQLQRQFLPSANWNRIVADSGLPDSVTTLIRTVVKQTRLMRFEKYEIAMELVHHFQDGHEQGKSYDDLIENFGETSIASQLFRNSKIRNRPMSIKAAKGFLGLLGGSVVGFIALHLFYNAAVPNPTVDYSAMLNEAVTSMPDDQKAWPQYRALWTKYGLSEGGSFDDSAFYVPDETAEPDSNQTRLVRPSDPQWPKAVAKLESMSDILNMFRDNAQRPYLGTPLHVDLSRYSDEDFAALRPGLNRGHVASVSDWGMGVEISEDADELLSTSTVAVLLPHVQRFRAFTRYVKLDTLLAIEQGDSGRASANIKTIFGFARQVGNSPILVQKLVGAAIHGMAFGLTQATLDRHPDFFTDTQLADLRKYVGEMKPNIFCSDDIDGEINFTRDLIQRIYSDDGNGDGRMTPVGAEILLVTEQFTFVSGEPTRKSLSIVEKALGPAQLFSAPTRKEVNAALEDVVNKCREEASKRLWETSEFDFTEYANSKAPGELLETIGLACETLRLRRERFIAERDCTVLGIAAHEFRRQYNRWPDSMDELLTEQQASVPIDPHTGQPVKYSVDKSGIRIYSIGANRTDEGGQRNNDRFDDTEGDWLLWPRYEEMP